MCPCYHPFCSLQCAITYLRLAKRRVVSRKYVPQPPLAKDYEPMRRAA